MIDKKQTPTKKNNKDNIKKPPVAKTTSGKYIYALGRRKTAIARVKLFANGSGKMTVNARDYKEYFPNFVWSENLEKPFEVVGQLNKFDVAARVLGGGPKGQSEAVRLGIARCLVKDNADNKSVLRTAGFMTRDPRAKERKKPGLKRARRAPQWSKR